MQHVIKLILVWGIVLPCVIGGWGCKGGAVPELGGITGPASLDEYGYTEYSVSVGNATGATFLWSCDPASAGHFDSPDSIKTGFAASMVTQDTPVKISVAVGSQQFEPVVLSKGITVRDSLWTRTWGGGEADTARSVAVDSSGNAYVTGVFRGTVDLDPGPGIDEYSAIFPGVDTFLSKFDPSGNFQWTHVWGATDSECGPVLAVDESRNIYVAGAYDCTVDFDPGPGVDEHTTISYFPDMYLSKFDNAGGFLWARTWGGYSSCGINSIAIDENGNSLVAGAFQDSVDFDPGTGIDERTSGGGYDTFLSKFDPNGYFLWTRTWGGNKWDKGYEVGVDASGSPYVVGYFSGVVDFDPGPGVDEHSCNGRDDIFLSKFDSYGNFQWAYTFGGSGYEYPWGIVIDANYNICIAGDFEDIVVFNPGPDIELRTSNGKSDAFLCKFPPDGNW